VYGLVKAQSAKILLENVQQIVAANLNSLREAMSSHAIAKIVQWFLIAAFGMQT
jgi:hypothetical protein